MVAISWVRKEAVHDLEARLMIRKRGGVQTFLEEEIVCVLGTGVPAVGEGAGNGVLSW